MIDPIDKLVGGKVKLYRKFSGLTQTQVAEKLGLTFQQIQKNECGSNRIPAGRLFRLSQLLNVPIENFFSDSTILQTTKVTRKETQALVDSYLGLSDKYKKILLAFIRAVDQEENTSNSGGTDLHGISGEKKDRSNGDLSNLS